MATKYVYARIQIRQLIDANNIDVLVKSINGLFNDKDSVVTIPSPRNEKDVAAYTEVAAHPDCREEARSLVGAVAKAYSAAL